MICRKCGSEHNVKSGKVGGAQRYKCKGCGFQFTKEVANGRGADERGKAVALYLLGLSMRAIAKVFRVNVSTVLYWVRNFAAAAYAKPTPRGAVVVELDEMWHFIQSKKTSSGSGRLIVALPVNSLTGNVGIVAGKPWDSCSTGCGGWMSRSTSQTAGKLMRS
jgi:transposase-like protein